jgi:hypothetical protein
LHRPASNERIIACTSAATERRRPSGRIAKLYPTCDITAVTENVNFFVFVFVYIMYAHSQKKCVGKR